MINVMFIMLGVLALLGLAWFALGRDRTDYEAQALDKGNEKTP